MPMIRRTSSETLPILVNASTSASFTFGLLSTAAETSLLESRMSDARCSRVPFIASFMRSSTDSDDSSLVARESARSGRIGSVGGSSDSVSSSGSSNRSAAGGGASAGTSMPSAAKNVAHFRRRVLAREERAQRLERQRVQRGAGGAPDLRIGVVREQHEQRELLLRPRRQRALRREQAHVARHFAAAEEIDQGGRRPGSA